MTDLTPRQLIDTIVRSLDETGKRMAAKYKRPAPRKRTAGAKRKRVASSPPR
ncbi:MAG TPA: hypothetical protein VMM15_03185 [Bradyrhizobium sp.]|nr:hypothetical protein [Bradyrhizobium sp.]